MANRDRTAFGARLLQARTKAGLTQVQVAKKLEISQGTLSELEREAYSSGLTPLLAKLYGEDAHYLATGDRPKGVSEHAQKLAAAFDSIPFESREGAFDYLSGVIDRIRHEFASRHARKPKTERTRSR